MDSTKEMDTSQLQWNYSWFNKIHIVECEQKKIPVIAQSRKELSVQLRNIYLRYTQYALRITLS